jgi:ATP-dependent DNA helicase UvrD/PcrA
VTVAATVTGAPYDRLVADPLLDDLDAEQRAAVTAAGRAVKVVAGPGSGKTRVLTRRVAWRCASGATAPDRTLVVTFTRRAARELSGRLARLGLHDRVTVGTLHALALARLRRRAADAGRRPARLESPATILTRLFDDAQERAVLLPELTWASARELAAADYERAVQEAGRETPWPAGRIAERLAHYETAKRRRRLADYDDLLRTWVEALTADGPYRAAEHWRVRHLLVDEAQDLSPLQVSVIRRLVGPDTDLFAVGDPDQAIYGFAGADPEALDRLFAALDDVTTVRLEQNHRSAASIVATAGSVLGRDPGPARAEQGSVELVAFADGAEEATGLVELVRAARRAPRRWRDVAVLARTNRRLDEVGRALVDAGVPVRRRRPAFTGSAAREALATVRTSPTLPDAVESLRERAAGERDPEARAGIEGVIALVEELLAVDETADTNALSAWLALPEPDGRDDTDAVDLATFHSAKGLEWPVVVLAGVEAGVVPPAAGGPDERAEEQRLLYVAMTRAADELVVTWTASRATPHGSVQAGPSSLLPPIAAATRALDSDGPLWREEIERQRSALSRPARTDGDVRRRVVEWRDRAARLARVSPTSILRDDLITTLARTPPADVDELVAVIGWGPAQADRLAGPLFAAIRSDLDGAGLDQVRS